jgi:hypothetical protein
LEGTRVVGDTEEGHDVFMSQTFPDHGIPIELLLFRQRGVTSRGVFSMMHLNNRSFTIIKMHWKAFGTNHRAIELPFVHITDAFGGKGQGIEGLRRKEI